MEIKKADEIDIYCPYCDKILDVLLVKQVKINFVATKPIYACPHCKKILPGPSF